MATQVQTFGFESSIERQTLIRLQQKFVEDNKIRAIFDKILDMFPSNEDTAKVSILGNTDLSSLAEDLANILASYINKCNDEKI